MRHRSKLAVLVSATFLLSALLAGCGGGGGSENDSGNGSGGDGQGGGGQQQESEKQARETKIAIGDVVAVQPDKRRMVVQPSQEAENAERVVVNVRKNAEITLGGEKAEMSDVATGQQAQAEYVTKNDRNRAISVQLFETEGGGGNGSN